MAFEHTSMVRAKEAVERMAARMQNMRKDSERIIGRSLQAVETVGSTFAWAYANGRWGEVHAADAAALPEITLLGVPADLGAGVALLAVSMFGGLGKYDEHGINVGVGSACAFGYRMGHELGSKAHESAPAAKRTTTKGEAPAMTGARGAHGGRVHQVWDERRVA